MPTSITVESAPLIGKFMEALMIKIAYEYAFTPISNTFHLILDNSFHQKSLPSIDSNYFVPATTHDGLISYGDKMKEINIK
jgi:hypothetical protein